MRMVKLMRVFKEVVDIDMGARIFSLFFAGSGLLIS